MAESVKHRIFIGNDSNPLDLADAIAVVADFTADSTIVSADSVDFFADDDVSVPLDPDPQPVVVPVYANNERVYLFKGSTIDVNVLYNDQFDAPVTVTIETPPVYGAAVVNPDNTVNYVHDGVGYSADFFTYRIDDGVTSDVARVDVSIQIEVKPPPPPGENADVGRSFNISNNGYYDSGNNGDGACQFAKLGIKYHDGNSETPTLGDQIFNDRNGENVFDGNGRYYAINNGRSIKISISGIVVDLWICGNGNA